MTGLDIFALIVLATLFLTGGAVLVLLGGLPGRVARERSHPQADAINMLGWLGLLFGGVGWVIAMVWARLVPIKSTLNGVTTEAASATDRESP